MTERNHHSIMVETACGKTFEAFTWSRTAETGIARAMREGVKFGYEIVKAWAEPLPS